MSSQSDADDAHRTGLIDSMAAFYGYQWISLRSLFLSVSERFGAEGLPILEKGFWRYGYYHGQNLRDRPQTAMRQATNRQPRAVCQLLALLDQPACAGRAYI